MPQRGFLANMNKKAIAITTVVALVILILGAWVMFAFAGKLGTLFKEDSDIETCRLSVLAQAQTRNIPVVNVDTPGTIVPLDCPRRNLKIYDNKVEINGKESAKYDFKKLTQDEINNIIAEEMRLCWYKMGEGGKNVFEHSILLGVDKTCLICAEIEFDRKLNSEYGGLVDYLKSRKISKGEISYYEYIAREQRNLYILNNIPWTQWTPWGKGSTERISEDRLITNQKYSIYFLAYKPSAVDQATGSLSIAYYIGLGKEDKLREECTVLVN